MVEMFYNCSQLKYINLKNFIEHNSLNVTDIFKNITDNIVVCLSGNSNKIKSLIFDKNCYTIDCSDNLEIKQKKKIYKTGICYNNLDYDILYKYEYNGNIMKIV